MSRSKDLRNEARREQRQTKKVLASLSLLNIKKENYGNLPNLSPDNKCPVPEKYCCFVGHCPDGNAETSDFIMNQIETLQEEAIDLGINPWETIN